MTLRDWAILHGYDHFNSDPEEEPAKIKSTQSGGKTLEQYVNDMESELDKPDARKLEELDDWAKQLGITVNDKYAYEDAMADELNNKYKH